MPLQEPAITLGSSLENEVVLDDSDVPPLALRLTLGTDTYSAQACTPKFKFEINGKKVSQANLKVGDILQVGAHRLIFDREAFPQVQEPKVEAALPAGLTKLCTMVAEERDLKVLLTKTMHLLLEQIGGNEAFLFTLDEAGQPAIAVSTRANDAPILFSDTIVEQVLRTKQGLFLGNALANPDFAASPSIIDLKLHSVLCCPIIAAGKTSGLIYLGSNLPTVSFDSVDLRELEVYALVVGCLINHLGYIAMQSKILAALQDESGQPGMVATCLPMKKVLEEARMVAQGEIAVLLEGETGTGKDVLAQFIHRQSRRSAKPFLVLNCSTLRGELLASELFGHKKGAFTGAIHDQQGFFAAANGGTLFLDEIGEMDLALQAMLLRTLETGMIRPVGQTSEIRVDVRLICATNRKLEASVAKGQFRQDLYYRINQHGIELPPLRNRGEDIILLAHYFLEKAKTIYPDKSIAGINPESLFAMRRYKWPGNIRELVNMVNKSVLFSTSPVITLALPKENVDRWMDMEEATRHFQLDHLQKALDFSGGDRDKAAAMLGMGRSTFFRYLSQARGQAEA